MSGVAHFVSGLPKTYRLVPVVSAPRAGSVLIPGAGWSRPIDIAIQLERLRHRLSVPELEAASHCGNGLRSSWGLVTGRLRWLGRGRLGSASPHITGAFPRTGDAGAHPASCAALSRARGGEDLGLGLGGGVVRPSSRAAGTVSAWRRAPCHSRAGPARWGSCHAAGSVRDGSWQIPCVRRRLTPAYPRSAFRVFGSACCQRRAEMLSGMPGMGASKGP